MAGYVKKRKVFTILSISLVLIFIISSIIFIKSKDKKSDEVQFVIGMSQANLTEPWRISMNKEIIEEAKKYKNIKIIYKDAAGDTNKQKDDINELLRYGVDLLIVSINDSEMLTPLVSKIYKDIPVIVLDRAVEGYDYSLYIGPDNESIGRQAGNYVADLIGKNQGNVIEIQGVLDSPPVVARSKGFREVLSKHDNIKITRTLICEWQRDEAEDKVTEVLKEDKNVDVIFAHNDYMALGAYKAVHKLHLDNIKIIGVDGLKGENGGLDMVSKGMLQGTFTCTTGGREAVDYAMKILNKDLQIPKKIILRSDKVTKDNVLSFIQDKKLKTFSSKKIVLGYAQLNSESDWRTANENSIKEAAKEEGIQLVFLKSGTTEQDQKRLIRELIKKKVDVISFSPFVENGWDDVLEEAKQAGIPVIVSDRTVDSDNSIWKSHIGSDFYEEGKRAAKLLINHHMKKAVNILEIKGNSGSSPTIERDLGFRDVIQDYSNYKILGTVNGNFTYDGGKSAMKTYLKKYGKSINVVFAQNDDMGLGAIEAIKEFGLTPGKDIVVLGIDGTRKALEAVKKGDMDSTTECNPLLGYELMENVKEVVRGNEVPLEVISQENVFTKDISNRDIKNRKY